MKLVIFSGTSEGHALCRFVSACGGCADVYVATDYGAAVMEPLRGITVNEGRLDADAMEAVLDGDTLLVDATHPYAALVSDNLRAACAQTGAQYERLLRPALDSEGVMTVPDTAAAVRWLNAHPGRVLLTTGSKELEAFTAVEGWRERLVARVLPSVSVLEQCASLGFAGAQIVAMQGPFSQEMNVALLRQTRADILVTKDTGKAGGFAEKLSAVRETGATVLVIARPREEKGKTLAEVQAFLAARFGWTAPVPERCKPAPRFPLFVSLAGQTCVVFGAGAIAARRVGVLRRFGAAVTVVAPESPANIEVDVVRGYEKSDLSGAFLAVAATNDRQVNHRIAADCADLHIPCSVADCAAESTFFFPAVCEGGGLIAGVVSDGTAHGKTAAAAKRIRAVLEETT
ncbi:precorrin-6A reductase [Candidatus Agathobaculum pullicola]|uniref:precorrin-6A reductase n=1 Tax=Candidatus Agathobaculum pullicola TaxID=2838426 RepID=UPI003F8ECDCD